MDNLIVPPHILDAANLIDEWATSQSLGYYEIGPIRSRRLSPLEQELESPSLIRRQQAFIKTQERLSGILDQQG